MQKVIKIYNWKKKTLWERCVFIFMWKFEEKISPDISFIKTIVFHKPYRNFRGHFGLFFFLGGVGRRGHLGKFSNKKGGNLVKIVCVGEEEGIYVNFPTKRKKKKPNTEKVNHDRRAECSDRDSDCNCKIYSKEKINKKCVFLCQNLSPKNRYILLVSKLFFS